MRNSDTVAAMLCPVCKTGLAMSDRQGIEIDYCPSCRGVWLDRGEPDKIIERSTADMAPLRAGSRGPSSQELCHDDDDDDEYRRHAGQRRKKSFLFDLFD